VIPTPTRNYTGYREALREAAQQEPEDWTFKNDIRFQRVLEHVDHFQGFRFIEQMQREYATYWQDVVDLLPAVVEQNDRFGKPYVDTFHEVDLTCSPSNFRYLSQALRLFTHAAEVQPGHIHVIELGGGYGGLALYVHRLAHLFPETTIDAYTIIDLPEACAIQQRVAHELELPILAVNGLDETALEWAMERVDAPRFLFSAYAFSEFDAETRAWYESRVARKCEHGVVIWNFRYGVSGVAEKDLGGPVYQFVDAPLRVEFDEPNIYPEGIQLVRF
jgi:hypothetical protein